MKPLWEGKRALREGAGLELVFEQLLVRLACCKGRRSSSNTWQKVGLVNLLHACQVYSMNSKHYKKQIPFNWISIIRYFQFQFTFLSVRPTERLHNRPQEVDQDLPYRCILDPLPVPWNTFCLFLIFLPTTRALHCVLFISHFLTVTMSPFVILDITAYQTRNTL